MEYVESITELIGNTPMIRSQCLSKNQCDVYIKLEFYNPGNSIKDRAALGMIEQAEEDGLLKSGYEVVEASSGNMAIGLAVVCAAKGYKLTLFVCDDVSKTRVELLKSYGANVIFTPREFGIVGAISEAENYSLNNSYIFIPRQFENRDNAEVHYRTTGPEIWQQMNGKVDIFVSSIGSGGTIMGIGRYLKERNPQLKVIAVEPQDSAVLSQETPKRHNFSGMGVNFIPRLLDTSVIDKIVKAPFDESVNIARQVAKCDGMMFGIATGAMMYATTQCTSKYPNSRIVTIGSVYGERYAGSNLYDAEKDSEKVSFIQEI